MKDWGGEHVQVMEDLLVGGFLLLVSIEDVRARTISTSYLGVGAFVFTVLLLIGPEHRILQALLGGGWGFLFFFLLWCWKSDRLGWGDVILSSFIGYTLGFEEWIITMFFASLFSLLGFVFSSVIRKKNIGEVALPFAPFVMTGWCMVQLVKRG